ncbi:MAG: hypothetical protein ABIP71_05475 [Verrucomicrobiota bacterium]
MSGSSTRTWSWPAFSEKVPGGDAKRNSPKESFTDPFGSSCNILLDGIETNPLPRDWTKEANELGRRAKTLSNGREMQSSSTKDSMECPLFAGIPEEEAVAVDLSLTIDQSGAGVNGTGSGMEVARTSSVSLKNNFLKEANMFLTFNTLLQSRFLLSLTFSFGLLRSQFLSQSIQAR